MPTREAAARRWTLALQGLLLVYGLAYIWNTSFVIGRGGERFFCLFDDAMISLRYARLWYYGAPLPNTYYAREPMHIHALLPASHRFFPGHLKWDLGYSIGTLKPDIVVQRLGTRAVLRRAPRGYVYSRANQMYFRVGSPRVRWDRVGGLVPVSIALR